MATVLVIGDVVDDIIVVPKEPIRTDTDTDSSIHHTPGGSASNIACWAANCGADVTFLGCVNTGDEFRITEQFAGFGVKSILQLSKTTTGSLVVLVEGETRSMLTDRGANRDLDLSALDWKFFSDFDYVFISGYSLFGRETEEIDRLIQQAQQGGAMVLLDPGSAGYIKDFGVSDFQKAVAGTDVLIPNVEEFELLGAGVGQITILKKGGLGVELYVEGLKQQSFPAQSVTSVDPTGAGDAFAGGLVASLARGEALETAIQNGISIAAKAVGTIGARPQL